MLEVLIVSVGLFLWFLVIRWKTCAGRKVHPFGNQQGRLQDGMRMSGQEAENR
jgi:hypothetical protein